MADYSKCSNKECPWKFDCARFLMIGSKYQTYSDYKWDKEKGCDGFWNVEDGAPFEFKRAAHSKSEYKRLKVQGVPVVLKED